MNRSQHSLDNPKSGFSSLWEVNMSIIFDGGFNSDSDSEYLRQISIMQVIEIFRPESIFND